MIRAVLGYTRLMMRFVLLALTIFSQIISAQANSAGSHTAHGLETGKILARVSSERHPEMSYAAYVPSNYSPTRTWPLVVNSDPGARGVIPLELQKDAAEKYGYVLVAPNDSRNGP